MAPTYQIRDLPTITDAAAIEACAAAGKVRGIFHELTRHAVNQLAKVPVTPAVRLALATSFRVQECSLSIEYLCAKNQVRDATILLLSLYELQLDLQYIARDVSRAQTWIDHAQRHKKPWSVSSQQKELFTKEAELSAERHVFEFLSMAKHGNPVGGVLSMPLGPTRDTLTFEPNDLSPLIMTVIYGVGANVSSAGVSLSTIWRSENVDVSDYPSQLKEGERHLSSLLERSLLTTLRDRAAQEE